MNDNPLEYVPYAIVAALMFWIILGLWGKA